MIPTALLGQLAAWGKMVKPDSHHYRRLISSNVFIPQIDGLRFIAIAAVFICHLPQTLLKHGAPAYEISSLEQAALSVMSFGSYGVQLFFLISGFVLALPFARQHLGDGKPVAVGKYYLRRVTRLEVPYGINLLLCALLLWIVGKYDLTIILQHFVASLAYSHNWIYESHSIINRVAWSLEIEVQFYLLAPLLTLVFKLAPTLRRSILVLSVISGSLLTCLIPAEPKMLIHQLHYFLGGFLLADLYLSGRLQRSIPFIATLAVTLLGLAYLVPVSLARVLLLPWGMFALGLAAFCSPRFGTWLTRSAIPIMGGMCYTIYLYHGVIISGLVQTFFGPRGMSGHVLIDTVLLGVMALPLTTLVCMAAFRFIERPCMRPNWPSELWNWLRDRPPSTTGSQGLPQHVRL